MSSYRIATRYAKSLIDLASEKGQLESVYKDIQSLANNVKDNRELLLMLKSPIIHADKKTSVLNKIYSGSFNELSMSFLNIIVRKHREEFLPEIAQSFVDQYNEIHKVAVAQLVTATAVDDKTLAQATDIVKKETGATSVQIETSIDESMIGGFVLKFNNQLVDASIKRQLAELRKQFSLN